MKTRLGFIVAVAIALRPNHTEASPRAESVHSVVEVLSDGALRVTDTAQFRVHGPERLVLRLPRNRADRIVLESASPGAEVNLRRKRPRVHWEVEPRGDSLVTVSLTYLVHGSIEIAESGAELSWRLFPRERGYEIKNAEATMVIPRDVRDAGVRVFVRNARVEEVPAGWSIHAGRLTAEETASVRVAFAPNALDVAASDWQQRELQWRRRAPLAVGLAVGLLLLGVGLVLSVRRDAASAGALVTQLRITAPPSNLSSVLAGALCDGKVTLRHAVACLLELADRGVVLFEVAGKQWGSRAVIARRLQVPQDLTPWERVVLSAAFKKEDPPGVVRAEHAWAGLRGAAKPFDAAVRAHLQRTREVATQRDKQGRPLHLIAGICGALTLPALALVPLQWSALGPASTAIPIAFVVIAAAALIAAATLVRVGFREHPRVAAWRGFAHHVRLMTKKPEGLDVARFHAWLPYAIALGHGPGWVGAAKRLHLQPPAWFHGRPDDPADIAALAALLARMSDPQTQTHVAA